MRAVFLLSICAMVLSMGCASRWAYLAESPTTKFYLDTQSPLKTFGSAWEVTERFLDISTDRWYLETQVRYDCQERTFMTLSTRGFSEHRPDVYPSEIVGNLPVPVVEGSREEARLEAICALMGVGQQ